MTVGRTRLPGFGRVFRAALLGLALIAGPVAAEETEMPAYVVDSAEGDIEVRSYPPMIVAEVTIEGAREMAITDGFRVLAEYIFGANAPGEKIAMTAPVTQQTAEAGTWSVRFMMPSAYSMETLPKPADSAVTLRDMAAARFAAIRFAGDTKDAGLVADQEAALRAFMDRSGLTAASAPVLAFYDPPWIPPEKRRNEILIEIES